MKLANLFEVLALDEGNCSALLTCVQRAQSHRDQLSAQNCAELRAHEGTLVRELNQLIKLRNATPKKTIVVFVNGGIG